MMNNTEDHTNTEQSDIEQSDGVESVHVESPESTMWSSRFAFVLAAAGSAVGLGNIWGFPYKAGENGGGAFVLVYLLCILVIGLPIMMAEIMIGRESRKNPINAFRFLAKRAKASRNWVWVGRMGVLAAFLILSFYSVIAGWSLSYVFRVLGGAFSNVDANVASKIWVDLSTDAEKTLAWHTMFMIICVFIVSRGVTRGLERMLNILMPMLFILLLVLVGFAFYVGDGAAALTYLFSPDFSQISLELVVDAMGQAFFSLSLGLGAILMYGAYLSDKASIAKTSLAIVTADTSVALISGLAIFPLVFATPGLNPNEGFSLVFQALPQIFGKIEGGTMVGVLFFSLLFIAAITSAVSLLEPMVGWLMKYKQYAREKATRIVGIATWFLGLGTIFSFSIWSNYKLTIAPKLGDTIFVLLEDQTIFSIINYASTNIMLPLGGALMAYFVGFVMKRDTVRAQLSDLPDGVFNVWYFVIRDVAPIAGIVIFVKVSGIWKLIETQFEFSEKAIDVSQWLSVLQGWV